MSFSEYVKEQEELQILDQENSKRSKLADFLKTIDDLNDEKFKAFAMDELGMDGGEAEAVVYKMLRDFLNTPAPEAPMGDELGGELGGEFGDDAEVVAIDLDGGDELGGEEELDVELGGEEEPIDAEVEAGEDEDDEEEVDIEVTEV